MPPRWLRYQVTFGRISKEIIWCFSIAARFADPIVWLPPYQFARDRLIYRDTFGEALAELTGGPAPARPALAEVTSAHAPAATGQGLPALAERLRRLRELAEQLARELETLEKEARKKKN